MTTTMLNSRGLPAMMVKALEYEPREIADNEYSVTQLMKPPQLLRLERRHKDNIERDASDMWSTFIGSSVHGGIYSKLKDDEDYILEQRLDYEMDGVKIGGTFDAFYKPTGALIDHKTMNTVSFGLEDKPEYIAQLNVYAYLIKKVLGLEVKEAYINAIYLDWRASALKYAEAGRYPDAPTKLIPIRLWSEEEQEAFIKSRIALHKEAEEVPDEKLPPCLSEEMWETPPKFAVVKRGMTRAMRVVDTHQAATEYIEWKFGSRKTPDIYIEHRPGQRRRCADYCAAAPFCKQYQEYLRSRGTGVEGELF